MLKETNEEYYPLRSPEALSKNTDEGIWFLPMEDTHSLMKTVSSSTGLGIENALMQATKVQLFLTAKRDSARSEEDVEIPMVNLTIDALNSERSGVWHFNATAFLRTPLGDEGHYDLMSGTFETIDSMVETLETLSPALIALAW